MELKEKFIESIVEATEESFMMILALTPQRIDGIASLSQPGRLICSIEFSGSIKGAIAVSLSNEAACQLASKMLEVEINVINKDVTYAIGEFLNTIVSGVSVRLASIPHIFDAYSPEIVKGSEFEQTMKIHVHYIHMGFRTEIFNFDMVGYYRFPDEEMKPPPADEEKSFDSVLGNSLTVSDQTEDFLDQSTPEQNHPQHSPEAVQEKIPEGESEKSKVHSILKAILKAEDEAVEEETKDKCDKSPSVNEMIYTAGKAGEPSDKNLLPRQILKKEEIEQKQQKEQEGSSGPEKESKEIEPNPEQSERKKQEQNVDQEEPDLSEPLRESHQISAKSKETRTIDKQEIAKALEKLLEKPGDKFDPAEIKELLAPLLKLDHVDLSLPASTQVDMSKDVQLESESVRKLDELIKKNRSLHR